MDTKANMFINYLVTPKCKQLHTEQNLNTKWKLSSSDKHVIMSWEFPAFKGIIALPARLSCFIQSPSTN